MSKNRSNKGHYIPQASSSVAPRTVEEVEQGVHTSILLRIKHRWEKLHWFWKSVIVPVVGAVWWVNSSALPRISIERETVQGNNSLLAEYKFTNTGILDARNIEIFCGSDDDGVTLKGESGGSFTFAKLSFLVAEIKALAKGQSATRGCRISFENNIPSGTLTVWARYSPPWIPIPLHRSATFTFRYDSAARGYVPVPDVTN